MAKKGASNTALWVAVIIVGAIALGVVNIPNLSTIGQPTATTQPTGTGATSTGSSTNCPSTGLTTVYARVTNPLNGSGQFVPATLQLVDANTGKVITAGSASSGSSYSSVTANAPCGSSVKLVALGNNTNVYADGSVFATGSANAYQDLAIPLSSPIQFKVTDNNYANQYPNSTWYQDTKTNNKTMWAQGTDGTWFITVNTVNSASQYGSTNGGIVICATFDTSKYSKDTVSLTGGGANPIALPAYCADQGYNKAWKANAINANTVFTFYVKADKGTPTGNALTSPTLYFFDESGFVKADSTVGVDIADANDALVGQTDHFVQIGISPGAT